MDRLLTLFAGIAVAGIAAASPAVIFGTIQTDDGRSLTGAMIWDNEEAYWAQHFNGEGAEPFDLSDFDEATREEILDQQPGPTIELGSMSVELVKWFAKAELRPTEVVVEFGAIDRLDVDRSRVTITLRDGGVLKVDGGSNDIGADIGIMSEDGAEREVDWDEIESIQFFSAPDGHPTWPDQIYGQATTAHGELMGIMAWDSDERFATEKLDGDLEDGRELSIEFGEILSIENLGNSSRVITRDGRDVVLDDSNDVDEDNRGLMLVNPAFGRIDVSWADLQRVDLEPLPDDFLPGRDAWDGMGLLKGEVKTADETLAGEIAYDVDEQREVEVLDGSVGKSRVYIPLHRIASIVRDEGKSEVTLRNGLKWTLDRQRDVSASNSGVVVNSRNGHRYVKWETVSEISFEPR